MVPHHALHPRGSPDNKSVQEQSVKRETAAMSEVFQRFNQLLLTLLRRADLYSAANTYFYSDP